MYKKIMENGRSMIEMLGVLAIVGVLSVGGIAGYSKAMEKYKIDKTISQIVNAVANASVAFANQKDVERISCDYDDVNILENLGIISHNMASVDKNNVPVVVSPFGLMYIDLYPQTSFKYTKVMIFVLFNLPKGVCTELATQSWGDNLSGFEGIAIGSVPVEDCVTEGYEEDYISDSGVLSCHKTPLQPNIAARGCNCIDAACRLGLVFQLN